MPSQGNLGARPGSMPLQHPFHQLPQFLGIAQTNFATAPQHGYPYDAYDICDSSLVGARATDTAAS
jgi:hypothetical protein